MPELTLEQVQQLKAGAEELKVCREMPGGYYLVGEDGEGLYGPLTRKDARTMADLLATAEAALERAQRLEVEIERWKLAAGGMVSCVLGGVSINPDTMTPGILREHRERALNNALAAKRIQELETEARTRESVRRNAGTHRLLWELGD